ncbi:hypothetical protein HBB16_18570 [Pseudonocardia sp. MCCB 268]|nr:hypothetical protein [Pseudonocardia cytotoxica]
MQVADCTPGWGWRSYRVTVTMTDGPRAGRTVQLVPDEPAPRFAVGAGDARLVRGQPRRGRVLLKLNDLPARDPLIWLAAGFALAASPAAGCAGSPRWPGCSQLRGAAVVQLSRSCPGAPRWRSR